MEYKIKQHHFENKSKEKVLQYIHDYINNTPINSSSKEALLDFHFINNNPGYYIDYPYLFSSAFGIEDETILLKLSAAGFLYYKSTILLDRILDSNISFHQTFPLILISQEECIKILSSIFHLHSEYWELWNKRKEEFINAFIIDHKTHAIHHYEDYENLADWKSALGKLAIDALYLLSPKKDETIYQNTLSAHKYFYCAFQAMDDILDFREDIVSKQFNVGYWALQKELIKSKDSVNVEQSSPETLAKYFHLTGVSVSVLELALSYLNKASEYIKTLRLDYFNSEMIKLWNTAIQHILNIQGYITCLSNKNRLSHKYIEQNNIKFAYKQGVDFIFSKQNNNGSWYEFCNNAGVSNVWSTAFITNFLQDLPLSENEKKKLNIAVRFISTHKYKKLWGYNDKWIEDIDSSIFAMLVLSKSSTELEFQFLLDNQHEDGGFATYYEKDMLRSALCNYGANDINTDGWTQSHLCVSSAALYLMTKRNYYGVHFEKLFKFIKAQQTSSRSWSPYWWSDSIYCAYFLTMAANAINNSCFNEQITLFLHQIISRQNTNGSFGHNGSAFYTGLIIKAVCSNKTFLSMYKENIAKSTSWLLSSQFSDGSWKSSHAMIMPASNILIPEDINSWEVQQRGINIKADDFARLYSTVTAVSALNSYASIL